MGSGDHERRALLEPVEEEAPPKSADRANGACGGVISDVDCSSAGGRNSTDWVAMGPAGAYILGRSSP